MKFDPKQIAMGRSVEKEHGVDSDETEKIAKDHLKEFPDYYTRLSAMEKEAKKFWKGKKKMKEGLSIIEAIDLLCGSNTEDRSVGAKMSDSELY